MISRANRTRVATLMISTSPFSNEHGRRLIDTEPVFGWTTSPFQWTLAYRPSAQNASSLRRRSS